MLFVELRFVAFFAIVFGGHWLLRGDRSRKLWLLVASYVFYAGWDWRFLGLILTSTLVDYVVSLRLDSPRSTHRKAWLLVSLITNLGLLGFFKYYNFFVESAAELLALVGLPFRTETLAIVLPVGISFYTFQTLSYTIDVYRRQIRARRSLLDVALFVGFFPQLVAGPIVRAAEFLPQVERSRRWSDVPLRACLGLFLVGFIKKACIADSVAPVVDVYFADPGAYTAAASWLAVLFYAVQIYCDFSGYSDMAIATAGLLGYTLPVNFMAPYLAGSLTEFWRRWHISLSTWLRDYLYIPLGGNRGSLWFLYRNLMLTMLIGGLWHGAAWNFVIWGGLHGAGLVLHKEWTRRRIGRGGRLLPGWVGQTLTLYYVLVAWIFFRAPDFAGAVQSLESFVLLRSPGELDLTASRQLWIVAALGVAHAIANRTRVGQLWSGLPEWAFAAAYGALWALALAFVPGEYTPFIYFQF